jgi:predicted branched-subunit amino acid permease
MPWGRLYKWSRNLSGIGQNIGVSISRLRTDSLSLAFIVGSYGTAFGAAAVAAKFSILQTALLSLLTFSGASQFAVVGVIASGGSAMSGITTASLLGLRNALYGLRLSPILKLKGIKKLVGAHITIDESTGIALSQKNDEDAREGFWWTGIGVFVFWNIFTVLGALGAKALGNPASWGLDTAVPAAFLGLLWPRLDSQRARIVAASAFLLSLVLTPFISAGLPIITCALIAVVAGLKEPSEPTRVGVNS